MGLGGEGNTVWVRGRRLAIRHPHFDERFHVGSRVRRAPRKFGCVHVVRADLRTFTSFAVSYEDKRRPIEGMDKLAATSYLLNLCLPERFFFALALI